MLTKDRVLHRKYAKPMSRQRPLDVGEGRSSETEAKWVNGFLRVKTASPLSREKGVLRKLSVFPIDRFISF